ncbi:MAG: hypothetical protein V1872_14300 [bacterium]
MPKEESYVKALFGVFQAMHKALIQTVGKSDLAVMRKAGNNGSGIFFPNLPSNLSLVEASKKLEEGVSSLEVFGELKVAKVEGLTVKVEFCDCLISRILKDAGFECGTQAPCYFGFGLVDETLKRLTGKKCTMSFDSHDTGKKLCFESVKVE